MTLLAIAPAALRVADGSVPAPMPDIGWSAAATSNAGPGGVHRWYGMARGTSLYASFFSALGINGPASPNGPFPVDTDQVALELQNPSLGEPDFINSTGNGISGWKGFSHEQL